MSTLKDWDSKLRFALGMASIVVLLLVSCFGNYRREIRVASVGNTTTQLSREERKQLLSKFFDVGDHRMVR